MKISMCENVVYNISLFILHQQIIGEDKVTTTTSTTSTTSKTQKGKKKSNFLEVCDSPDNINIAKTKKI